MNPVDHLTDDLENALRRKEGRPEIWVEKRRYGKDVTIVAGLPGGDLGGLARTLKRRLATGGSAKEDRIELQGDHRARLPGILAELGFAVAEP